MLGTSSDAPVTVVMAVKNGLPFLTDTLQSIFAQSHRNFQLLVWDNGSTDGTQDVLNDWIPHRISGRIITDEPLPLGQSRAKLIELADTEWCATIDSDDICLPERLSTQLDFLAKNSSIDVLGSSAFLIDEQGSMSSRLWTFPENHDHIMYDMIIGQICTYCHSCTMTRRSALLQCGNYRSSTSWHGCNVEDWDIALRLAANGFRFRNLQVPLVKYRVHSNSTTARRMFEGRLVKASTSCLLDQIPLLTGASIEEYLDFAGGHAQWALPYILRMAIWLKTKLGLANPLRDPRFLRRVSVRVNRKDILTRAALFVLQRRDVEELESDSLALVMDQLAR